MLWHRDGLLHCRGVMRRMFFRTIWIIFLAAILISGCTGITKHPEISLKGVDLVGLGLVEQQFVLKLRVRNPNDIDLSLNALRFDVELFGIHFARGQSDKLAIIPRHGEAVLEVTAVSRLGSIARSLREAQKNGQGDIGYRIYGDAELTGYGNYPFDRTGAIRWPDLEKLFRK